VNLLSTFRWPPGRRRRWLVAAMLLGLIVAFASSADAGDKTKLAAWAIGHNLSLAALLYSQDALQQNIDSPLGKAKTAAQFAKVDIKPFPPKGKTGAETQATMIHYLIKGDGWSTGEALVKKHSLEHGTLFEIAVKSNIGIILYQPGNDGGIANVIKKRAEQIRLPPELWTPVVAAMNDKRPRSEVQKTIAKMHEDVVARLLKDSN
jgi:hypothetical protein